MNAKSNTHTLVILQLVGLLPLGITSHAGAANLIVNGDFSLGLFGFTSGYQQSPDLTGETRYTVSTNPHLVHPAALNFGDHTTGTGQMLLLNGATSANVIAWRQTVPVLPNSTYEFSYWACSWGSDGSGNDQSPAVLKVMVNGLQLGTLLNVPKLDALYVNQTATWSSGNSSTALLEIVDLNTAGAGNDFILDDITFVGPAVPEPASAALGTLIAASLTTRQRRRPVRR